jgi:hypothetical protein
MVRRSRPIFICGGEPATKRGSDCPNALHDWPLMPGYADSSAQAQSRIDRRWTNVRCPDCGLYGWRPGKLNEDDVEFRHTL